MLLKQSTYNNQSSLAKYCRTGDIEEVKGVNLNRVNHYRRLVFNVVNDTLTYAYPLSHQLLGTDNWERLVNDFFSEHGCQSAQIWSMPQELVNYVGTSKHPLAYTYPVLYELLYFEWLEIEVYMQEDIHVEYNISGNVQTNRLIINPEHRLQHFTYPVHLKVAKDISQKDRGNYFLALHRAPESGKVIFTNLSPALVRVIEILKEKELNLNKLCAQIANEFNVDNEESIRQSLTKFLTSALKNKLILGFN